MSFYIVLLCQTLIEGFLGISNKNFPLDHNLRLLAPQLHCLLGIIRSLPLILLLGRHLRQGVLITLGKALTFQDGTSTAKASM